MLAITPEQVSEVRENAIPPEVLKVFNDMIVENFDGHSARLDQDDVLERVVQNTGVARGLVLSRNWLNVEDIFRRAGWKVEYDKPAYCENYTAYWIFSKK